MLEIKHVSKTFNPNTITEKKALRNISLKLDEGDFVTIIGGNGAGKSTLLNMIAGVYPIDCGRILLDGVDLSLQPQHKRAAVIGRVFQDPMMGTAADMEIQENLAFAKRRGQRRGLGWGVRNDEMDKFLEICFCCPCCCIAMRLARNAQPEDRIRFHPAGWTAVADQTKCIGCRKCVPLCPQKIKIHREMEKINTFVETLKQNKEF